MGEGRGGTGRGGRGRGIWKELVCHPSVRYSVLRMRLDTLPYLGICTYPCRPAPTLSCLGLLGYGAWVEFGTTSEEVRVYCTNPEGKENRERNEGRRVDGLRIEGNYGME